MGAPSPGGLQGQFQGVGLLQGANTIPLIWGPHLRTARFFVEFYYKMNIIYGFGKYIFFCGIRVPPGFSVCSRPYTI